MTLSLSNEAINSFVSLLKSIDRYEFYSGLAIASKCEQEIWMTGGHETDKQILRLKAKKGLAS